ncbi:MAG: Gfo/Idh/MocA family oxidoreductase [Candidatus Nanopelagicales bacterium]
MSPTPGAPVRWGFLGAGFVATQALGLAVHAAQGAELAVVGARDLERARALGPARAVRSYAEVCASPEVDAVYVALPNDDHLPWVLAALAAGKHVLCEKPLGRTAAEVATMTTAAQESGLLLVEAAWNQWHPRTRRFRALAAGLAEPRVVRAWFTFPGVAQGNYRLDPVRGGGALLDVGCYTVAAALAGLAGEATEATEAVVVGSVARHVGPTEVDLSTTAVLSHPRGTATVTASFEAPESQGVTVEAPGCSIEFLGPAFTTWRAACALRIVTDGVERVEHFEACDAYQMMVQAVSARIRGEQGWVWPLSHALAVAGVLDAISDHP